MSHARGRRHARAVSLALTFSAVGACVSPARPETRGTPPPVVPPGRDAPVEASLPDAGGDVVSGDATPEGGATKAGLRDFVRSRSPAKLPGGTVLPGPCVDVVAHAACVLADPDANDDICYANRQSFRQVGTGDLDGDGVPDLLVVGGGVRAQWTYYVYVRRGDCGYFAGIIPAAESVDPGRGKSRGLEDIRTTSDECPISGRMQYCEGIWRFDGTTYRPSSERALKRAGPPPEVVDDAELLR